VGVLREIKGCVRKIFRGLTYSDFSRKNWTRSWNSYRACFYVNCISLGTVRWVPTPQMKFMSVSHWGRINLPIDSQSQLGTHSKSEIHIYQPLDRSNSLIDSQYATNICMYITGLEVGDLISGSLAPRPFCHPNISDFPVSQTGTWSLNGPRNLTAKKTAAETFPLIFPAATVQRYL
jgi:hypothetical protein